jgi:type II secretory pathway predicted ATPase ExeA
VKGKVRFYRIGKSAVTWLEELGRSKRMYQQYWRLPREPFAKFGSAELFDAPSHCEALARMDYVVRQSGRVGLVLGPDGVGKSTLLCHFGRRLQRSGGRVVRLSLVGIGADELLVRLVDGLGGSLAAGPSPISLWQEWFDALAAIQFQQQTASLLLDDVDQAAADLVPVLRRLANRDRQGPSILMAADAARLGQIDRRLCGLVHLRIDVDPWDRWQTARFVTESLERAGAEGPMPIFALDALERLYERTGGVPRRVIQLADLSLIAGAGRRLAQVDGEIVQAAAEQLAFASSPGSMTAVLAG